MQHGLAQPLFTPAQALPVHPLTPLQEALVPQPDEVQPLAVQLDPGLHTLPAQPLPRQPLR